MNVQEVNRTPDAPSLWSIDKFQASLLRRLQGTGVLVWPTQNLRKFFATIGVSYRGGVVSVSRAVQPEIVFTKGEGAHIWDLDGNRYIVYHAAFAPHFLGHNDPYVTEAVISVFRKNASLYGGGTTQLEGQLEELICRHVPTAESVVVLNTGSEATCHAIHLARAVMVSTSFRRRQSSAGYPSLIAKTTLNSPWNKSRAS